MAESKKTVAAEIQDKPTAPAETLSELDKLVVAFIDGALDVNEINKLDIFNRWLVLSMSAVYSCTKIGLLSAKSCVKAKYKLLQEYRRFRTDTFFCKQGTHRMDKKDERNFLQINGVVKGDCRTRY